MTKSVKQDVDAILETVKAFDFEKYAAELVLAAQKAAASIIAAGAAAQAWAKRCPTIPADLEYESRDHPNKWDFLYRLRRGDLGADMEKWIYDLDEGMGEFGWGTFVPCDRMSSPSDVFEIAEDHGDPTWGREVHLNLPNPVPGEQELSSMSNVNSPVTSRV